jgi:DNA-binding PadR family transcriptional regulator
VHLAGVQHYRLTAEQAEEVERIRENLRSGRTELLSDDDMKAFWQSCGV